MTKNEWVGIRIESDKKIKWNEYAKKDNRQLSSFIIDCVECEIRRKELQKKLFEPRFLAKD